MLSGCKRLMRPHGLLLVMAVAYAVLAVLAGVYVTWVDLAHVRQSVESDAAAAARLLEERLDRMIDASGHVAARVSERLAASGGGLNVHQVSDLLEAAPYFANIVILDPAGRVVLQARGGAARGESWAEVPWVQALRTGTSSLQIGPAAVDEGSRAMAFPMAHRVIGANGKPVALVAVLVDVNAFKPFLQALDGSRSPAIGIYRDDGVPLMRQPWRGDALSAAGDDPLFKVHVPAALHGTFHAASPYDGVQRLIAYRVSSAHHLVVWVGQSEGAALAEWRGRVVVVTMLAVLGFGLMLGLSVLLLRQLARERRASAELASLNRDLERSNADLEQFAYIASHDLKEPLRNIASYVQLLQRRYQGQLDPDADAFIGYTVDGVRRLQAIINELLAYSRIGTGQMNRMPVQSGALVSTALAHLKGVIAEAQAVVEVKGPLPVVQADSSQLGSLFQNLIGNALKYRREDVRSEVTIGAENRGDQWAFYVRDNGIGIDPQYHRQIFDLFKRLHPRDRYAGTGIGLAVCQRVVERHGGHIWVNSMAGKGATFWFTLPKH